MEIFIFWLSRIHLKPINDLEELLLLLSRNIIMDTQQREKFSSAFTLSDMEIFIFPELLYSLVLANIMSPIIWKWRNAPWFEGIDKMGPLKKVHRVKQYIMDHYDFNLDLETWGLTDKQTEINRFKEFIDVEILEQSNALFGYEGDKYYFDIDIRRHFGLDKYQSDIIPYWKTETIEAMNAFRLKPGHTTGAGECVSLACLYAATLFIIAKIPLEKIFLMGTPLHSQNFVLIDEGVVTNNRRIVTKTMWFNGTELSALAKRALEHERVTIVAHSTGYIHVIYPEATIGESEYNLFKHKLSVFLETHVNFEIFTNFLRSVSRYQNLFQLSFPCANQTKYIRMEKAFAYEHDSKYKIGDKSSRKLLCEIDEEDLTHIVEKNRAVISSDNFIFAQRSSQEFLELFQQEFPQLASNKEFMVDLKKFIHTVPKLPSSKKFFSGSHPISFSPTQTREEIMSYLSGIRNISVTADLAFYTGRYLDSCDWEPFLMAAFERNPVSIEYFRKSEIEAVFQELSSWSNDSIYDGNRLALPDEVVNYCTGDGLEKTLVLLNIARSRHLIMNVAQHGESLILKFEGHKFDFPMSKKLKLPLNLLK
jgi:hypothetical protein